MKDLGNLMKQAQALQERMGRLQEELAAMEVAGSAGAGLVTVTLSGKGEMKRVKIDPSLLRPEDAEMVEDLVAAAHSDAKKKMEAKVAEETQALMGGLALPPGLKLPF
ncbi:MAG: YbaB/EbfC family nucleoid-associated protein [Alphaproteobacteria bacterium]